MDKIYEYQNGSISVTLPTSCDRERLKKETEEFLKKVFIGGIKNGNDYTSGDFGEK